MRGIVLILPILVLGSQVRVVSTVERINHRGWADSWRMTNGQYSLIVVPQIGGRIMEYSIGGTNVLWENAEEYGKTYPITNDWRNFGGYKTWVSPQDYWRWPPDPILDRGPATVEEFEREGIKWLRITGQPSPQSGVVFMKEITLDHSGEVTLIQRMRATGKTPTDWGIHDVTQVRTPCFVVFPVSPKSRHAEGFRFMYGDPKKTTQFTVRDGLLVMSYHGQVYQIGADSDGPWMVWFKDDLAYVKLFPPMQRDRDYGDRGSSVTLFTSDAKLGYMEMEILDPLTKLAVGEETELTEQWRLFRLDEKVRSEYSIKRIIAGMIEKGMIPPAR